MRAIDQLEYDSVDGPHIISVSGHYRQILPPVKSQASLCPVSSSKRKLYLKYDIFLSNSVCPSISLSFEIIHTSTHPRLADEGVLNDIHHQNCLLCERMSERDTLV